MVITGVQIIFHFRPINCPAFPFSLQMGLCSSSKDRIPQQVVHFALWHCPREWEEDWRKSRIHAGLTLAVAVISLFWHSLRQFHFSVSVGEQPRPRLTLWHRVLQNKTQRTLVQASASKAPQAPIRGTQVDQLMSQLLIETSSYSFMPSLCPTPGIISPMFSTLQARKQLRWGFYKPSVPPLNLKVVQGIQSWEEKSGDVTSSSQRQSHLAFPHSWVHLQSHWESDPNYTFYKATPVLNSLTQASLQLTGKAHQGQFWS